MESNRSRAESVTVLLKKSRKCNEVKLAGAPGSYATLHFRLFIVLCNLTIAALLAVPIHSKVQM